MKLPRFVPQNQKPQRVLSGDLSQRKQAQKPNPSLTISRHQFARVNQHRRSQLLKYVPEMLTEYDNAECCCKPEKVVVLEGIQVAEPELVKESYHRTY